MDLGTGKRPFGMHSLRAEDFPALRTVDSTSWLIEAVRGRHLGVAMRMAVLGLAFDHLDAPAAVTSADGDKGASLGVSQSPDATTEILRSAPVHVDVTVYENAGHFDFMTELPPGVSPTPGLDHAVFLGQVASRIAAAVG